MEAPTIDRTKPRRKERMSYEEYLALLDEVIVEWVDGEVIFHVPPTPFHQSINFFLSTLIGMFVKQFELGQILTAPVEVKLWPGGPSREPDIIFIGRDKFSQIDNKRFNGAPDLVVEVVSPGSVTIDRVDKFREYERAGVGEYWIIDPRHQKQQADFYVRNEQGVFTPVEIDDDGVYASALLPGFRLQIAWLWQPETVNIQRALAVMLADAPGLPDELRALYREMARLLAG
jgi:Uma2 family endonuclease